MFVPLVYFLVLFELTADKFWHYFLLYSCSLVFYTTLGQWLVYATPTQPIALVSHNKIGAIMHVASIWVAEGCCRRVDVWAYRLLKGWQTLTSRGIHFLLVLRQRLSDACCRT